MKPWKKMETIYPDSKVKIGNEEWTVKYYSQVFTPREGRYVKAARIPSKKEIWLSVNDESNKKFAVEDVTAHFQKAILPMVIEDKKKEYGAEKVEEALKELGKM